MVVGGLLVAVGGLRWSSWCAERGAATRCCPCGLFRARQFSAANGVTFIIYGALGGALFLLPVERQVVSGYTPLAVRA